MDASLENVLYTLSAVDRFFRFGKRYGKWKLHNPLSNGRKCLVAAVASVYDANRNSPCVPVDAIDTARYYIERAVRERGAGTILEFSNRRRSYGEIAAVIARAKELAQAKLAAPAPSKPPARDATAAEAMEDMKGKGGVTTKLDDREF
jgi:hypothetical protein